MGGSAMNGYLCKLHICRLVSLTLWAVIVFGIGINAVADEVAITLGQFGGYSSSSSVSETIGWHFQVNTNIVVTQLGLWDQGGNGLNFPHRIGLWGNSQQLLSSVMIFAGSSATLINDFRYVPISSITLIPGNTYVIGAYYSKTSTEPRIYQKPTPFTTSPYINWDGAADTDWTDPSGLTFPSWNDSEGLSGAFGPSFTFIVPEPSTSALLWVGLAGLLAYAWRGQRQL